MSSCLMGFDGFQVVTPDPENFLHTLQTLSRAEAP